MSDRYRLRSDIRFRVVGEEAVVLRLGAGRVLGLNATGTRVLELVEQGCPADRIIEILAAETQTIDRDLERDVSGFLRELVDTGIVEPAR